MGRGSSDKKQRAMQQKIRGGMNLVSQQIHRKEPSKAELREMIPAYDESMVKRIEANAKSKRPRKRES
jgi:hypothetical protein